MISDTDYKSAFEQTIYTVYFSTREHTISLTTGNAWMEDHLPFRDSPWCYITAWNPLPAILTRSENDRRNKELAREITSLGLSYYPGMGSSSDGNWSEASFWVLGIDRVEAQSLAKKHGQKAILVGQGISSGTLAMI